MAKGSRQRPLNISMKAFDNSWDTIFNKLELSNTAGKAMPKTPCIKCVTTPCSNCSSNLIK